MSEALNLTVTAEEAGQRLDAYLASVTDLTRSAAVRLIDDGQVTVNGKSSNKKEKVKTVLSDIMIPMLIFCIVNRY